MDRSMAMDSLVSQDNALRVKAQMLLPEEIQEFALFPAAKPLSFKKLKNREDFVFADMYFDENRALIEGPLSDALLQPTRLLAEDSRWLLQIEGHCDPRGSSAYNYSRAGFYISTLTDYLYRLGVPPVQISTMNYGQDPVSCQVRSERCQEDNLRAEKIFSILSVGSTRRGCVVRLRIKSRSNWSGTKGFSNELPVLQMIQLASPSTF